MTDKGVGGASGPAKSPMEQIVACVELHRVRLTAMACESRISSPEEVDEVTVRLATHGEARTTDAGTFDVDAKISLEIVPVENDKAEADPVVDISAIFCLSYSLGEDIEVSDEDLSEFADMNGIFNAWPYFRELIQSAIARMGLPPITMPVYRIGPSEDVRVSAPDENVEEESG